MAEVDKDMKVLPLEEPSAKQLIDTLSKAERLECELAQMDEVSMKIVIKHLLTERASLLEDKNRLALVKRYTPVLDFDISTIRNRPQGPDEDEGEPAENNGYVLKDSFAEQWHYREDYKIAAPTRDADFVVADETSPMGLRGAIGFNNKVSSQLLLYRLVVVFGMPPQSLADGYKTAWAVNLVSSDNKSVLYLSDHKGSASLNFSGTKEGSEQALKLVNFLVSKNVPHTYDGTLAGTQA